MADKHTLFKENLAAFALGALEGQEAAELAAHLQTCAACRADLAEYQRVSDGLLMALPPRNPGPGLRRNLQKQIRGTGKSRNWNIGLVLGRVAVGGVMLVLVGISVFSMYQVSSLKAELTSHYDSQQTAIAMLAYPSTQTIGFDQSGITGSLLVDKKRDLVAIFAWRMPLAPAGKTYQMWLIDPQGDRTSGGFLKPEADEPFVMAVIKSPQPLADFVGLGVTVEPAGGSPKPTGEKILRVDF